MGNLIKLRLLMQRHVRLSTACCNNGSSIKVIFHFFARREKQCKKPNRPTAFSPLYSSVLIGRVVFVVRPIWTAGVVLPGCVYLIID